MPRCASSRGLALAFISDCPALVQFDALDSRPPSCSPHCACIFHCCLTSVCSLLLAVKRAWRLHVRIARTFKTLTLQSLLTLLLLLRGLLCGLLRSCCRPSLLPLPAQRLGLLCRCLHKSLFLLCLLLLGWRLRS